MANLPAGLRRGAAAVAARWTTADRSGDRLPAPPHSAAQACPPPPFDGRTVVIIVVVFDAIVVISSRPTRDDEAGPDILPECSHTG